MTFMDIDRQWVEDQLKKNGTAGTIVGDIVIHLLDAIESAEVPRRHPEYLDKALDIAGKLAKGFPIVSETDSDSWTDLHGGDLNVRDIVRVRVDAYEGEFGVQNNGRRGRVVAMRNGKITVLYDGDHIDNAKGHEISVLQKLDVE